jgi:Tol biopolymer transport system component
MDAACSLTGRMQVRSSILGALVVLGVAAASAASGASTPVRWIVFSALPKGLPPAQLFRVQTNGTGLEQITTGTNIATSPAFSPDGQRIVFARLGLGIFVMNLDGSGLRKLSGGTRDQFPVWSPDGKHVAFLRVYKSEWRLYVMSPSGSAQRRLVLALPGGRPSWTADSKLIFIPVQGGLDKLDARDGRLQRLIPVKVDLSTSQAATVSPNSRRVAFVGPDNLKSGPPECGEVRCPGYALYLADVPAGRKRRIAIGTGPAGWSPDSKSIVFVNRGGLALWPAAGSGTRTKITTDKDVPAGDAPPAWQPR